MMIPKNGLHIWISHFLSRAVNSIDFYWNSAYFNQFEFGKNIKLFEFEFRLTKKLSLPAFRLNVHFL